MALGVAPGPPGSSTGPAWRNAELGRHAREETAQPKNEPLALSVTVGGPGPSVGGSTLEHVHTADEVAAGAAGPEEVVVRAARAPDVRSIRDLVTPFVQQRVIVHKEAVAYYEMVTDFVVAESAGRVVGCGAVHVLWEDLAEVRTLAVAPDALGHGVGSRILERLIERGRELGVERLFCLTFETDFFARHGFTPIEGQTVEPEVYAELLRSYDEGVAEFLDLERVKPNTLGNTRMVRSLVD